jgi:hypothetical protein
MRGLKPSPPSDGSFSASCEVVPFQSVEFDLAKARPRLKPTILHWLYARVKTLASLRREFFRML